MNWFRSLFSQEKKVSRKVVVVIEGDEEVVVIPPPVLLKDQDTDIDQVVEEFIEEGVY